LGGSSAINAQVFVPPSTAVIDAWESLGNPGWNWKTLEPYYTKIYSFQGPRAELNHHLNTEQMTNGKTGLIQISNMVEAENQIAKAWIETFESLGHDPKGHPFSGELSGAFIPLATIDLATKERTYSTTRYYTPIAGRKNLHVLTDSLVQKIVIEEDGPKMRATGVEITSEGQITTATARCEVILAAGSFQSPKMLEFSGIGEQTCFIPMESKSRLTT
jgi:choline dehydrogenase-like flavoprotein